MSALDLLAERYGIEASFRDAHGTMRITSVETRTRLLQAMGVEAQDEDSAGAALASMDLEESGCVLAPVCVLSRGRSFDIAFNFPASAEWVRWHVALEDGAVVKGEILFASLALQQRYELDGLQRERRTLTLPKELPSGYHTLTIESGEMAHAALIISPAKCWLPPQVERGERLWGVAAQLYLLKSEYNWGIGDFTDLTQLVNMLTQRRADIVGLNPLHAMFTDAPEHASPYSPASRLLLNVLNIDVSAVVRMSESVEARELIATDAFRAALKACRERDFVDYSGVAQLKLPILRLLFDAWRSSPESPNWRSFCDFRRSAGEAFERTCLFLALREHFVESQCSADWRAWPAPYQNPHSPAVAQFAQTQERRVAFQAWLQYIADRQLAAAASATESMAVGLYRDLAVGADPQGAETWTNQSAVVSQAQVGAPPDIYNPAGQDWGLPPFHPRALRAESYRSFIELLRANMRHAGALRIDHVMALKHLYWIPRGCSPAEGAYVQYPFEELLAILALESERNQCLVVGEDLGTVPEGFRERLAEAQILSYRVLLFEKNSDGFVPPQHYPTLSLAVAGSHDLPTLRAWWSGEDLALKERLGLFPDPRIAKAAQLDRRYDREELLSALQQRGLCVDPNLEMEKFIEASHAYLGSSAAALAMLQLDDLTGEVSPVNVPTTSEEYPNWRRRLALSLEQLAQHPRFIALTGALQAARAAEVPADPDPGNRCCEDWTGTYRLQLHKEFPLDAARDILPYLKALGISHVYLSPCLQASAGSKHGYDVTDSSRISEDLGGEAAWDRFIRAAKAQQLRLLLDIVPNHMAASADNLWWDDVLAQGPYSQFKDFFDIRLDVGAPFRLQLCSLARAYGEALQAGEISMELTSGLPRLKHFENTWPLSAASLRHLLDAQDSDSVEAQCWERLSRLQRIACPSRADQESYAQCRQEAQLLLAGQGSDHLAAAVKRLNADPYALDAVLQQQFYALHSWKLSGEMTNYRRFFEVDSLVGLRTELAPVMRAVHARIATMIAGGELDGLRVDHPDGLADPKLYFKRLRELLPAGRIYIEKILENDERLDESWQVDGTVGYDFLAKSNRLWMDDSRLDALTATYTDFTGHSVNVGALVRQKQRDILESAFQADLGRLTGALIGLARADFATSDLSARQLREALAALTTALPLYRTYRTGAGIGAHEMRIIADTIQATRLAAPQIDAAVFDFLYTLFTKPRLNEFEADFITKWQQLTPAVMAKGVEDTTFYVFDRLLSCNEVGASASLLGISSDKFHEYCHYLSEHWPQTLLATSTHDNKRSEDVRTRISVLTEIPDRWAEALHHWSQLNADAWQNRTPDRHAEYLLYQTLVGAWPIDQKRCWEYMLKASREAKIRTSWHAPNAQYEEKLRVFTENVFQNADFMAALQRFVAPLIMPGRVNSLAQTLLKLVAPGVPDFYQGTELWDLSLVDPDNRRPVDYALRSEMLEGCAEMGPGAALRDWDSGLPKLWLISRVLQFRARHPEHFDSNSGYRPLIASGARLSNLFAFQRGNEVIVALPRFNMTVKEDWQDTRLPLPSGRWSNLLGPGDFETAATAGTLFAEFPVAVLVRSEASAESSK
jgi:(1->4)-alpha-D-glucan 1-alpha-D-glucosylmutase